MAPPNRHLRTNLELLTTILAFIPETLPLFDHLVPSGHNISSSPE